MLNLLHMEKELTISWRVTYYSCKFFLNRGEKLIARYRNKSAYSN